jgi:crotonobetainyl-CoA:carnitine CoA-transferase CaiB-like acyl-CoA transferase
MTPEPIKAQHRPGAPGAQCPPYNDRHWFDFFEIAGRPDLARDPRLADAQTRRLMSPSFTR